MTDALKKFATDLVTAGIAAAAAAVLALNLDAASPKTVALVAVIAFLNGIVNAARRGLADAVK